MRSVLITGGAGHLGAALVRAAPAGVDVHATQRTTRVEGCTAHTVELSDGDQVRALFQAIAPDLVIHTAYTMKAGERDIWLATRNVADACRTAGCELIHLSTDLLLDGESAPYSEDAQPAPVHDYGIWKARAEAYVREVVPAAAVVRASLMTSFHPPDPRSEWVARSIETGTPIGLFVDEIRTPILTVDLVAQLWEMAGLPAAGRGGVWHLAGPESLSRYALGLLVAASLGLSAEGITPTLGRATGARRPRDLRLLTTRADRELSARARPLSEVATAPRLATSTGEG